MATVDLDAILNMPLDEISKLSGFGGSPGKKSTNWKTRKHAKKNAKPTGSTNSPKNRETSFEGKKIKKKGINKFGKKSTNGIHKNGKVLMKNQSFGKQSVRLNPPQRGVRLVTHLSGRDVSLRPVQRSRLRVSRAARLHEGSTGPWLRKANHIGSPIISKRPRSGGFYAPNKRLNRLGGIRFRDQSPRNKSYPLDRVEGRSQNFRGDRMRSSVRSIVRSLPRRLNQHDDRVRRSVYSGYREYDGYTSRPIRVPPRRRFTRDISPPDEEREYIKRPTNTRFSKSLTNPLDSHKDAKHPSKIELVQKTKGKKNKSVIIVSNIPKNLCAEDLKDAFSDIGVVLKASVQSVEGGKSTATIEFQDSRAAESAIQLYDDGDMNGQPIQVEYL